MRAGVAVREAEVGPDEGGIRPDLGSGHPIHIDVLRLELESGTAVEGERRPADIGLPAPLATTPSDTASV